MDDLAFTVAGSTVVATMAAGFTEAEALAGAAGTMTVFEAEDSIMKALGTVAAFMVEEGSAAAEVVSTVAVDSTVVAEAMAVEDSMEAVATVGATADAAS